MTKQIWLVMTCLALASMACIVTDAQQTIDTISDTAGLLQEIEDSGTWRYTLDGIDAITTADGYQGTLSFTQGETSPTGEEILSVNERVRWEIQTDAENESLISVIRDDERRDYLLADSGEVDENGNTVYETYRLEDGELRCLASGDYQEDVFATDVGDVFAEYGATAIGVQIISVAEEDGSETLNDFETTRYKLVSKLPEAIEILSDLPSEGLRRELEDVPEFYIDGTLHVDQETNALVGFQANYANLDENEGSEFIWRLAELGGQPDISLEDYTIALSCDDLQLTPTPLPE